MPTVGPRTITFAGQCLIKRDVRGEDAPGFLEVKRIVAGSDHAFTNLEVAIDGEHGGAVTKTSYVAVAKPAVLDALRDIGFDMLSVCNNHAFDYGRGGIRSAMEEAERRGFLWAGAGPDLDSAARPRIHDDGVTRTALIAVDCGPQVDDVYARNASSGEPARPGLTPLRIRDEGGVRKPDAADLELTAKMVRQAREHTDLVVVYTHSHHWEPTMWETPAVMVDIAHHLVDAGADIVVGHGTPALQGIELYHGRPIFYGLGNFIFHSWNPDRWLEEVGMEPWRGVVATCRWGPSGALASIDLVPIAIGHDGPDFSGSTFADVPVRARGAYARQILTSVRERSEPFGTKVVVDDEQATVTL